MGMLTCTFNVELISEPGQKPPRVGHFVTCSVFGNSRVQEKASALITVAPAAPALPTARSIGFIAITLGVIHVSTVGRVRCDAPVAWSGKDTPKRFDFRREWVKVVFELDICLRGVNRLPQLAQRCEQNVSGMVERACSMWWQQPSSVLHT